MTIGDVVLFERAQLELFGVDVGERKVQVRAQMRVDVFGQEFRIALPML